MRAEAPRSLSGRAKVLSNVKSLSAASVDSRACNGVLCPVRRFVILKSALGQRQTRRRKKSWQDGVGCEVGEKINGGGGGVVSFKYPVLFTCQMGGIVGHVGVGWWNNTLTS